MYSASFVHTKEDVIELSTEHIPFDVSNRIEYCHSIFSKTVQDVIERLAITKSNEQCEVKFPWLSSALGLSGEFALYVENVYNIIFGNQYNNMDKIIQCPLIHPEDSNSTLTRLIYIKERNITKSDYPQWVINEELEKYLDMFRGRSFEVMTYAHIVWNSKYICRCVSLKQNRLQAIMLFGNAQNIYDHDKSYSKNDDIAYIEYSYPLLRMNNMKHVQGKLSYELIYNHAVEWIYPSKDVLQMICVCGNGDYKNAAALLFLYFAKRLPEQYRYVLAEILHIKKTRKSNTKLIEGFYQHLHFNVIPILDTNLKSQGKKISELLTERNNTHGFAMFIKDQRNFYVASDYLIFDKKQNNINFNTDILRLRTNTNNCI